MSDLAGALLAQAEKPTRTQTEQTHMPQPDTVCLPIDGLRNFSMPIYVSEPPRDSDNSDGMGEAGHSSFGCYACMAVTLIGLTSMNYFLASLIASLPNMSGIFWETMLGWGVANCIILLAQHKTWEAIQCEDTTGSNSVVTRLLYTNVLPETAQIVRTWRMDTAKKQQTKLASFTVYFSAFMVVLGLLVASRRGAGFAWTSDEITTLIIACVTAPMYIAATGVPTFISVALFNAMADPVLQMTRRVQSSVAATVDFDELMRDIRTADADITKLVEYAKWLCLQTVIGNACAGMPWAIIGLGPQPPADHWWTKWHLSYICCANCVCFVLLGIWTAFQAAKITDRCDQLRDAINRLRVSGSPESGNLRVASPEQMLAINNLLNYMDGLNEGAGMGLCLFWVRVSYSFVANVGVSAASVLGILFTTLLRFVAETGTGSSSSDH